MSKRCSLFGGTATRLPFKIELSNAPSEAEGEVSGTRVARTVGGVSGSCYGGARQIVVEQVADAGTQRESSLKQCGRGSETYADGLLLLSVKVKGRCAVADIGIDIDQLGHLCP